MKAVRRGTFVCIANGNRLLVLGGNMAYFPFPMDRYDPDLLDMTEEEEPCRLAA